MSEKQKIISNTEIVNSQKRITGIINEELQKGIPISVLSIILRACIADVDMMLNTVIASENNGVEKND